MSTSILPVLVDIPPARYIRLPGMATERPKQEDLADFVSRTRYEKGLSQRDVEAKSGGEISKGYDVYRSVAPVGDCDIIILKQRRLCRIEVKTARRTPSGRARYNQDTCRPESYDILALVFLQESLIQYQPSIEAWFECAEEKIA